MTAFESLFTDEPLLYYKSPFGDDSLFNEKGYAVYIDFKELLAAIRQGSRDKQRLYYSYKDFDSDWASPVSSLMPYPGEIKTAAKEAQQVFKQLTGIELPFFPAGKRGNIPYKTDTPQRIVPLTGMLNVRDGYVKIDREHIGFKLELNLEKRELKFTDLFLYDEPAANERGRGNWAFAVSAGTYPDYLELCRAEGLELTAKSLEHITGTFEQALKDAAGNAENTAWLYEVLPGFVFEARDKQWLINGLLTILTGNDVDEDGVNEEAAALRILNAFVIATPPAQYALLQQLTAYTGSGKAKGKTGLELLYDALNDTGGKANFTACILTLYKIWLQTSFSNADNYLHNGQPDVLAYQSKKILGFYSDDYRFAFAGNTIAVEKKDGLAGYDEDAPVDYLPFATYPLLYPIQLPEVTQDGELKLPDTVIPAFYLKAFADKNAWANFEKEAWIAVDVITTATGAGNLLKLRHLATLGKTIQYIRIATGTLQLASGIVGTMLNFANDSNSTFCQKLRTYLFWLDVATLGVDAFTERMLHKSAKEALEVADSKVPQEVKQHLDEVTEAGKKTARAGDINKSFFENAGIALREEKAIGKVLSQTEEYTCVANSLRMALDDFNIVRSEQYLAAALETTTRGANILDIPKAIQNAYIEGIYTIARGGTKDKNITAGTLEKLLQGGRKKAVVSVYNQDLGAHAVVVDKIAGGRVFIRDPLPLHQGSCYSIAFADFEEVFNRKFVTFKK